MEEYARPSQPLSLFIWCCYRRHLQTLFTFFSVSRRKRILFLVKLPTATGNTNTTALSRTYTLMQVLL